MRPDEDQERRVEDVRETPVAKLASRNYLEQQVTNLGE